MIILVNKIQTDKTKEQVAQIMGDLSIEDATFRIIPRPPAEIHISRGYLSGGKYGIHQHEMRAYVEALTKIATSTEYSKKNSTPEILITDITIDSLWADTIIGYRIAKGKYCAVRMKLGEEMIDCPIVDLETNYMFNPFDSLSPYMLSTYVDSSRYVDLYENTAHYLYVAVTKEGVEEIENNKKEYARHIENNKIEYARHIEIQDLLDDLIGNGYDVLSPEMLGWLTGDIPTIGYDVMISDDGESYEIGKGSKVWAYYDYCLRHETEDMIYHGYAVFNHCMEDEEDENEE